MTTVDIPVEFTIRFHTPFRVSAGHARPGVADAIDPNDPLPASSLKGVMRATASTLLGTDSELVDDVFGSAKAPSPWKWSRARPDSAGWHTPQPVARVAIDPDLHTARPDMLAVAEQTGAGAAFFSVSPREVLTAERHDLHSLVLAIAGQATRALGATRRRGLGWVSIRCTTMELDEAAVRRFLELRSQ